MEHFVTLFNSLFLPQGLALHRSLERHAGSYTLWILCVDDLCADVLARLHLPRVRPLRLSSLETPALKSVKHGRTVGEYCWTLTPFSLRFVFDADASVTRITYVDADVWFRAAPHRLLEGFVASGKAVQITDHAYASEYDQSATSGRFCVQFMTFTRGDGEPVRSWWEARCLEWCFARVEDGKFGDQLYLDDWPERFSTLVHVLQEVDRLQAPWNATRFAPGDAVAFHFHGLRLLSESQALLSDNYRLHGTVIHTLYRPYLADLSYAIASLRAAGHEPPAQRQGSALRWRLRALAKCARTAWRSAVASPVHVLPPAITEHAE